MMETIADSFAQIQGWLFERVLQPALFALGLTHYAEIGFDAIETMLLGIAQIAMLYVILRPLEARFSAEHWPDRNQARVDALYTFLHRLGVLPLLFFFLLGPAQDALQGWLRLHDIIPKNIDDFFPALFDHPLISFVIYFVILDFADYWRHRLQHRFSWWWALHSLHHSQRQMTFWTDDRNHLLDDVLSAAWFAFAALLIGVSPNQFVWIVIVSKLLESLSHANLRLSFGSLGDRLLVSPRFHRVHHAIGLGHEGRALGINFGKTFSLWDMLFRTACFESVNPATGIRDQLSGRDYGNGFWRQQGLGVARLAEAIFSRHNTHPNQIQP
jgi:sterol desaturase/sphingolipid hydroxylase (fatty acid hydroxylase superfamily)